MMIEKKSSQMRRDWKRMEATAAQRTWFNTVKKLFIVSLLSFFLLKLKYLIFTLLHGTALRMLCVDHVGCNHVIRKGVLYVVAFCLAPALTAIQSHCGETDWVNNLQGTNYAVKALRITLPGVRVLWSEIGLWCEPSSTISRCAMFWIRKKWTEMREIAEHRKKVDNARECGKPKKIHHIWVSLARAFAVDSKKRNSRETSTEESVLLRRSTWSDVENGKQSQRLWEVPEIRFCARKEDKTIKTEDWKKVPSKMLI